MALQTSATINGTSYGRGSVFTAACNFTGKAASDGSGANSTVTKGTSYQFLYYNPGSSYPYAIGNGGVVRCWVKAGIFPYATYTVSYNANGGSGAPGNQTKTYGSNLTLSSTRPSRTGYTFQGWATSSNGSVVYQPGSAYTLNAGVTLYAVWKINGYTVSYNANGGSGAPEAQTKTHGLSLTLRTGKPTRTGYTFQGWATTAGGSVSYSAGGTYVANTSITLYAVWQQNTYYVAFNANGGSGSMGSQAYTYTENKRLNACTFERTGYTFQGWATGETGSKVYSDGQTVEKLSSAAGGTVTLYAVWKINKYTVTFNATENGGSGNTTKSVNYGSSIDKLPAATKKYYVFAGWYTAKTGGTKITSSYKFTKDTTVYAQYVIDASVYIRVGGKLKPGFPYVYHNGKWRKGYTYARKNNKWNQGLS